MIYLTNGNMPLNAAYSDEIVQEENSTYQLSFRFPTSDPLWEKLKEETFLSADDLHGEQDFVIFEIEKKHGYIQVYANQVFTLLNNYVVNPISLDRQTGSTALSRFAGSITRDNPFSFFSDIEDRHTFNVGSKNAMEAFAKDKHSIIGQWGGDLVRHGYQVRLLKNGGSENESLFMYKKNLSSYQHKTSTKSLKTRITFIATVKGEGEKAHDRTFTVTIDSPLINKYSQIYEDVIEVNDQDVKDEASLRKYGEQYYRTSLCDMMEDSLEIEVVGQSDVPVQMFDVVSIFHERYNLDVRKKITKYTYSPMAKKLKSIGFGQFQSGLANAIGNAVSDAVKGEAQQLHDDFERQLARELKNADLAFDRQKEDLVNQFQDGMGAAYSKAEEVRMEVLDTIDQRFSSFDNGPLQEVNRRAEEALQNAGASSLLALEAKRIGLDSIAKLEEFKRQTFNTQSALSGAIDALKRTVTNDIRPKQAQAEAEIAKQVEALNRTKNELAGVKSAQAIYEESTTHRLSELTNLANGKASKSELTQTAEVLASKIASVQVAHKNQGDRVSAVESNFKQRADSLETGVSRLTEGLRTKADISSLNVTAENIRQSVKSLETSTQNKLNQKLNLAEFEVRAGSIRQEILNATKDKADKTLVVAEAGKLREEFSKMKVGGRNYAEDYDFSRGLWIYSQGDNSPQDWTILNGEYNVKGTTNTYKQMQIHSREGSRSSWKSSTALLELEVGETYTLSFQGICYSGSPKVWVSLRANRTVPGNPEIINGNFNLTPSWQTYQVTIPALTKPDDFDFWRIILGYNEIGHVAFRKVELTRSSTRIDAGPAPEDGKTDLVVAKSEFQKTAEGLRTDMSAIQEHVNKEGQRQEVLRRYTREESAQQANAVRELVARNYVGKSDYQEDVKGLERRFSAISTQTNNDIATKIAQYKQTVDGRFADISSLISGKANQTDFQRVQETSRLYERILGNTNNSIADNIARMALTSQLFQVEVSKASASGRNLFLNSLFKRDLRDKYSTYKLFDDASQTKGQLAVSIDSDNQFRGVNTLKIVSTFNGKIDNQKITFNIGGNSRIGREDELKNKSVRFSFWAKSTVNNTNFQVRPGYRSAVKGISLTTDWQFYDIEFIRNENSNATSELILHIFTAATVWIAFPKVEIGTVSTPFSEAPEDTDEAVRSVQSQLAGSWSVQNINSAGDLISGVNLGANGYNRFDGKLTHITGETLIDKAVIKSAMVDKLKTGNFEAGSVTTVVLDAEAVTAEKLKVDQAFFNKLVANEAYLSQLFAKQAFINRVQSVAIDASQVRSGILSGDRIYGGTIRGASIYGGTLTGHTKIQLGSYGSFDIVDGGLQINVPRTANAKDGLGVQFIGSYGRGENAPYGLFIYKDSDFTVGSTAETSDDFLLTVEGYIKAKGIGWLKIVKGNVGGKDTAKIGFWDSDVSLNFGGSENDIYYSYAGKAYGLWSIINQHFSDRRLKENIVDCKHKALDYIHQFQFKEYDWKKQEDRPQKAHTRIGLIAQEVQTVDPTLVYENGDTLNLDNLRLTNIALKAIQELALENQKLTHRLENLENEYRTA
ncbi:phage tail spike protein [Streptococcus infantis]|uniref:phage tail spike protein n=1 Tax=Streptococcus infantis TaxID=68892 RepID=UPI0039C04B8C